MRVLFVNESTRIRGGIDTVLDIEMDGLNKSGISVDLLELSHTEILEKNSIERINNLKLYFSQEEQLKLLKEKIKVFNPNIIHFHNTYPFFRIPLWSHLVLNKIKIVQHLHNFYPFCLNSFFYKKGNICTECFDNDNFNAGIKHSCYDYSKIRSMIASYNRPTSGQWINYSSKVDLLIGVSQFVVNKYIELGVDKKKIKKLYNGILIENRTQNNVVGDYVLFMGNIVEAKGIQIVCELAKRNRDIDFKLAGLGRELIKLKKKYKFLKNLSFEGYITGEKKSDLINNCKFLLFPTKWWEPFGIVITEALSFGKFVVTSGLGGTSELVENGVTGFIVNNNDINSYEKVVRNLWYNLVNSNISIDKQEEILDKFSQKKHTENLIKHYKSIL